MLMKISEAPRLEVFTSSKIGIREKLTVRPNEQTQIVGIT